MPGSRHRVPNVAAARYQSRGSSLQGQNEPTLYAIADYEDLYVLGAHQRRQLQVLNEFDPCCSGGDHRSIYEPQVQDAVRDAGGGSFAVFMDRDNHQHSIGRAALDLILSDIETQPAK